MNTSTRILRLGALWVLVAVDPVQASPHTVPAQAATLGTVQQFGEWLVAADGLILLARPGQPVRSAWIDGRTGWGHPDHVVELADGGYLTLDARPTGQSSAGTRCQLRRFGPALEPRWHQQLEIPASVSEAARKHCLQVAEDQAGNLWLPGAERMTRLSEDGVVRAVRSLQEAPELREVVYAIGDPQGPGTYIVGAFGNPLSQVRQSGAARLDGDGNVVWQWIDPQTDALYTRIQRLPNGQLALEGSVVQSTPTARLTVLDGNGQLRWRHPQRTGELLAHAYGPAGQVLSFTRPAGLANQGALSLRDATGQLLWSELRGAEPGTLLQDARLAFAANSYLVAELMVPSGSSLGSPGLTRIQRLDAQAQSLWVQRRGRTSALTLALRADGSVLFAEAPTAAGGAVRAEVLAAADGAVTPLPLSHPAADHLQLASAAEDANGALALIVGDAEGRQRYRYIDAAGQLVWQQEDARYGGASLHLPDRVCASRFLATEGLRVECRARDDGRVLGPPLSFGVQTSDFRQQIRVDGGRSLLIQGTNGISVAIVDPELNLVRRNTLGFLPSLLRYAESTELAFLQNAPGLPLQRVDSVGFTRFSRSTTNIGNGVLDLVPLDNGETLLRVRPFLANANGAELQLLGTDGNARWTAVFTTPLANGPVQVVEIDDRLVVAVLDASPVAVGLQEPAPGALLALQRSDGRLLWRRDLSTVGGANTEKQLRLDTDNARVLLLAPLRSALDLRAFDPTTGADLPGRLVDVPEDLASTGALFAPTLRLLRVEARRQRDGGQGADLLLGARASLDAPATPGVENPGRTGAWYDPSSAGQGLLLDLVPGSRTLYAAWFTQDSASADAPLVAPARLRWYSLQGEYTVGARHVDLQVLENRGGRFAEPPVTTARQIGNAALEFTGCGSAVLSVSMDEPGRGPLQRRIALRALAVRDARCDTPTPVVEARGFNSRASGAWLDPATGGQGLVAMVQPPAEGSSGLFFAGWFHYDPGGQADDPGQQAWLTLQGDLSTASGGSVEVGIFRTLGSHLAGPPTANTRRIGSATVRLQGCDRMELQYRFSDTEMTAPYRALAGRIMLGKLGGCGP